MKINPNDELAKLVNKVYAAKPADALFVFNKEKIDKISASVKTITEIMHRSIDDLEVEIAPDELLGTCLELTFILGDGETFGIPPTANSQAGDYKNFCAALSVADAFNVWAQDDGKLVVDISYHNAYRMLTKKSE